MDIENFISWIRQSGALAREFAGTRFGRLRLKRKGPNGWCRLNRPVEVGLLNLVVPTLIQEHIVTETWKEARVADARQA